MTATLDAMFSALSSGPRREIISHLTAGAITTPELGAHFAFSKQALNRHLVALEDAGLVRRELIGRVHVVRLEPAPLTELTEWADTVRTAWNTNLDRLGDVLAELEEEESS
ncbi:MAG: helix-turn-helix domain-containing protein [Actinomycetota bacterium]